MLTVLPRIQPCATEKRLCFCQRQTDHRTVTPDQPFDEYSANSLNAVSTGLVPALTGCHIGCGDFVIDPDKFDRRRYDFAENTNNSHETDCGNHLVGFAGKSLEHLQVLDVASRFAQRRSANHDDGVCPENRQPSGGLLEYPSGLVLRKPASTCGWCLIVPGCFIDVGFQNFKRNTDLPQEICTAR